MAVRSGPFFRTFRVVLKSKGPYPRRLGPVRSLSGDQEEDLRGLNCPEVSLGKWLWLRMKQFFWGMSPSLCSLSRHSSVSQFVSRQSSVVMTLTCRHAMHVCRHRLVIRVSSLGKWNSRSGNSRGRESREFPSEFPAQKRPIRGNSLEFPYREGFELQGGVVVATVFRLFVCPCDLISLHRPLYNWLLLAWKPHWRLKSPRPVKSIQHNLTESELGKVK